MQVNIYVSCLFWSYGCESDDEEAPRLLLEVFKGRAIHGRSMDAALADEMNIEHLGFDGVKVFL